MILKSLSRKTPSFGQLAGYMSESGYMNSQKADERFEIFRNCFAQNSADIAAEFQENSQALARRKNGNYLYHEILSITIEDGVERQSAKEALRELALKYVSERAPNNLTYGALHDDHSAHIHYHLMISANERGSGKRYWISSKKLDSIKRGIEADCLAKYPELKQQLVMGATREDKQLSRKASELKRQSKKLERHEYVRRTIFQTMTEAQSLEAFHQRLQEKNFTCYKRGKHHGVEVRHPDGRIEKYRFATLGIANEYEAYQEALSGLARAQEQEEPEKTIRQTSEPQQDALNTPSKKKEKKMSQDKDKPRKNPVRETARHVAHEAEELGKVFRYGITGDEELGKTLKEQDREDLENHMEDLRVEQQEKIRDDYTKGQPVDKEIPRQEKGREKRQDKDRRAEEIKQQRREQLRAKREQSRSQGKDRSR